MSSAASERPEIDFWSSSPINWPAIWAVNALLVAAIGLTLWVGDYSGAASLTGIGVGSGCFVWARIREERGAEANGWRYAGIGIFVLTAGVQVGRLLLS
ncbi:hypothetical protein [Salinibacter sp.]|uniref:hypothetical protein n=1 Tax=Salinibacter sp. TaxID=2065818 RepID=UPI0021E78BBC|nr:hypothetical protein [Salinibacter sp.]